MSESKTSAARAKRLRLAELKHRAERLRTAAELIGTSIHADDATKAQGSQLSSALSGVLSLYAVREYGNVEALFDSAIHESPLAILFLRKRQLSTRFWLLVNHYDVRFERVSWEELEEHRARIYAAQDLAELSIAGRACRTFIHERLPELHSKE